MNTYWDFGGFRIYQWEIVVSLFLSALAFLAFVITRLQNIFSWFHNHLSSSVGRAEYDVLFRAERGLLQQVLVHPTSYQEDPLGIETQHKSIYSSIGVGVYQGEVVTFRKMAFQSPDSPIWVIANELPLCLTGESDNMVQELLFLACFLELYRKQPDLVKNYLQKTGGIKLKKCLLKPRILEYKLHQLRGQSDSRANVNITQQEIKREQPKQGENRAEVLLSLDCSHCPLQEYYK